MPDLPIRAVTRTAKLASLPLGMAGRGARVWAEHRGASGRGGNRGDPGAYGRAGVPRPRGAQGRRDEVRAGAVDLRGGAAGRGGEPVPRGTHQAAGGGTPAARHRSPRGSRRAARPAVAIPLRAVRRHSRGRCVNRAGASSPLGRWSRSRSQGAVPGCRPGAAVRLHPGGPAGPAVRCAGARARHQFAAGGAQVGSPKSSTTGSRRSRSAPSPRVRRDADILVPKVSPAPTACW